jgi:hypothetical protein
LLKTGGAAPFLAVLHATPEVIEATCPCLLTQPGLLDLRTKQAWLATRLSTVVGDSSASTLSLVATRGQLLQGLCAQLGVDETTGRLVAGSEAARARPLDVRFEGEAGGGDGLRREWFGEACCEMLDPSRGLFVSKDGNCTLQPNPHSATTAGPDHLSYFALLGRIAGLALYHREHLDAQWSTAFLKAALGYPITADDLESVDPELFEKRIVYLREALYASRDGIALAELSLTFVDDSSDAALIFATEAERRQLSELKPGGADVAVTGENMAEYLQLFAERRLLGAIRPQVEAFREGLSVFLGDVLQSTLRQCCSVAEIQLMLCGVKDIDVDDWEATCKYSGGLDAESDLVVWFWAAVREMSREERSALLHFCTGSVRVPAQGFASLMGYSGQQQRFTLARTTDHDAGRLPTASTCFNTLYLPACTSPPELKARLLRVLTEAGGFDEAAVA